jgi:hypothetical protein
VRTIGALLEIVLNDKLRKEVAEGAQFHASWQKIIYESFMGRKGSQNIQDEDDFEFTAALEQNRINAIKTGDHSRIKELHKDRLIIEADHQGWIQILETKRRQLLSATKRRFPTLVINTISFKLAQSEERENRGG